MDHTQDRELIGNGPGTDQPRHLNMPVYTQLPQFTSVTEKDRLLTNSHHRSSDVHLNTDDISKINQNGDKRRAKNEAISFQPQRQNIGLLSHNRLVIPSKADIAASSASDVEPLVIIQMDESSEEEFNNPRLHRFPKRDITRQLMQDGYNLDLQPDDNDLDLIPPKSNRNRCTACCSSQLGCGIQ